VDLAGPRANRAEVIRTRPTWVLDGLGLYNPALAIATYAEMREWLQHYRETGRTDTVVIYRLIP
jgi:hypothetical protein